LLEESVVGCYRDRKYSLIMEGPSDVSDERTARWWKCLGLPSQAEDRLKLREGYNEKVKALSAAKLDDPLSESIFEIACKDVVRDLNAGFHFPQNNEISLAARNGKLDGAEMAVGIWLLDQTEPKRQYQSSIGVLAAVIYYQLSQSSSEQDNDLNSDKSDEDIEADCFLLLNEILKHMSCFLQDDSQTNDVNENDGLFDDDAIGPMDTILHAIASKLVSVDPELFDCIEAHSPIAGSSSGDGSNGKVLSGLDDNNLKALGGNSLDRAQSASLVDESTTTTTTTSGGGGDDEASESRSENDETLWCRTWFFNFMSRQCDGNPQNNLFRIWDEVLNYISYHKTGLMTPNSWVDCLAPIMIAMLISIRNDLLNKTVSLSSSITIAGDDGAKWSRIFQSSRLIRNPEMITQFDNTCKVATFQIGPLGLVLGPAEDKKTSPNIPVQPSSQVSSLEGKALRVRKFQRSPINQETGRGGEPMQAEVSGKISIGDILVAVNGVNVPQGLTASGVVDLLKRVGRPVKVAFRTPKTAPPPPPTLMQVQQQQQQQQQQQLQKPGARGGVRMDQGGEESYSDLISSATTSLMDNLDPEVMQGVSQAAKGFGNMALAAAARAGVPIDQQRDSGTPPPLIDGHDENHEGIPSGHTAILLADDDFKLPVIAGEVYEAVLRADMHNFQRPRLCDGALEKVFVHGQLFVSNYRIYFHVMDQVNTNHFDWHIPVHTVERFESSKDGAGSQSSNSNSLSQSQHSQHGGSSHGGGHGGLSSGSSELISRTLGLHCKDGQVRRFTAQRSFHEDHKLTEDFHQFQRCFYKWSYGKEDAFAKIHSMALDLQSDEEKMKNIKVPEDESLTESLSLSNDFERLGLNSYTKLRLVKQNEVQLCLTYPLELLVPAFISNKDLIASAKYRSKQRLPVITWFDIRTGASIARSSQPLVGMNSKRCFEDEKLLKEYAALTFREGMDGPLPCTYYIVDARSKVATRGNQLMGKGVEQIKYYRDGRYSTDIKYMNIGNIHAVRESFDSLSQLCQPGSLEGSTAAQGFYGKLDSTGWLSHTQSILKASNFIVETVTRDKCSVLVHCSDGWDRTPQLCATAQLLIDAHYRTLKGFAFLVEKEWVVFGHKFSDRCAHSSQQPSEEKSGVFTLWIDCVWQIMRQYPTIFEFNEDMLVALLDHLYSCRFGSFIYNSFIDRNKATTETRSIWTWVEQHYKSFLNPNYEKYTEGPVLPSTNPLNMVLWDKVHQRYDMTKLPLDPNKRNPKTFYD